MKNRVILHSDLNNFFASIECLYHPECKGKPIAVTGDPEARHGIILAKNEIAKKFAVKTGEPMWTAKQKCPDIVFLPAHYDLYVKYSDMVRNIYYDYTDKVEPFGLDECWLDVTGSASLFGSGKEIADSIRKRVKTELGVSVSVGVSFNKIFAKLGSDMKKPDATTVIESEHFKEIIWPLPVNELLYIGRSTCTKLRSRGISTIGDLAAASPDSLRFMLGKNGEMLWKFANGLDTSPVSNIGAKSLIKSVGNSTTTPRNLVNDDDVKIVFMILAEKVSERLRKYGFICETVQISVRDSDLYRIERQGKLDIPNRTAKSIFELAFSLYKSSSSEKPIRSLGIRACNLEPADYIQLSLLPDAERQEKQEILESAVDEIREIFGSSAVQKAVALKDRQLSGFVPHGICSLPFSN